MTTQTSGSGGASAPSLSTRESFWEERNRSFQFSLQMMNSLTLFDNTYNFINQNKNKIYKPKINLKRPPKTIQKTKET